MKTIFRIQLHGRHREILQMIDAHRYKFLFAIICSLLVSGTTGASAYLIGPAIDKIFIEKDLGMIALIPVVIIILFLIRAFSVFGQDYFMSYVGQDIIRQLRNRLYSKIQDLPISFFQKEKTGVLMSRITNDVNLVKNMVSDTVKAALGDSFTAIFLIGVIFYRDWKLALIAMVVLPAAFLPVVKFLRERATVVSPS